MGNSKCRIYITKLIDNLIKANGIDIYRQDYNVAPLDRIQSLDKPGRTGLTENLYVQGYLQFWDDLLKRNPGLIIDSCASGGRRNDLETMRRSVPLHYSDFGYGNTVVKQGFQNTLFQWFPYFKEMPVSDELDVANRLRAQANKPQTNIDEFAYYIGISAPLTCAIINLNSDDSDFNSVLNFKKIWEQVANYFIDGDYYLLGKNTRTTDIWTVRQFDMPGAGEGVFQLFRNIDNKDASFVIHPKCTIKSDAKYEFTNIASGSKTEISGSELIKNGFKVSLRKREACLIKYKIL
jgi:alpha-galactosidase